MQAYILKQLKLVLSTEQVGSSANTSYFRLEVLGSYVGQVTQYPS
jgi:hypothetical protein